MIREFNNKRRSSKVSRQNSKKEIITAINDQAQELQEILEEMRAEELEYFEDYFDGDWYYDAFEDEGS